MTFPSPPPKQDTRPAWVRRLDEEMRSRRIGYRRLYRMVVGRVGDKERVPRGESTLRAYREGSVTDPDPEMMALVADALGLNLRWIMEGVEPRTVTESLVDEVRGRFPRPQGIPEDAVDKMIGALRSYGVVEADLQSGTTAIRVQGPADRHWDADLVGPAFLLAWQRLVQAHPDATTEDVVRIGRTLLHKLGGWMLDLRKLNGDADKFGGRQVDPYQRSRRWYTDTALGFLHVVTTTAGTAN